jgi:hypothetical protein
MASRTSAALSPNAVSIADIVGIKYGSNKRPRELANISNANKAPYIPSSRVLLIF